MDKLRMVTCPLCGGHISHQKVIENAIWGKYSVRIAGIDAEVCEKCGEKYYSREEATMMQNVAEAFSASTQPITADGQDAVLNIKETADILRISNQSVYNMIRDGRIQAKKIGREWRFLKSEIEAMVRPAAAQTYRHTARKGEFLSEHDRTNIQSIVKEDANCD